MSQSTVHSTVCRCLAYSVLSIVSLISGCSDRSKEAVILEKVEYYRETIGATSASLLFATLHADELVVSKLNSGTVTKQDQIRVVDLLKSLERHQKRLREMLDRTYEHQNLQERDQKYLPAVQELISATNALNKYLINGDKNESELKRYFLHRDKFLEKLKELGAYPKILTNTGEVVQPPLQR